MSTAQLTAHAPQASYERQAAFDIEHVKEDVPSCYTNPDSIDNWTHKRMYANLLPLIDSYRGATWMTIGDGRYASDAHYLAQQGVDVTATSLTDHYLEIAKAEGYIDKYRAENAERLSGADNSCDFVLCKSAYHHFPRPAIAFYEMLRVARKAAVLIEPQETSARPLEFARSLVKRFVRRDRTTKFEPCGNFIFRVNVAEMAKMMTALNYEVVAVRRFNYFYHAGLSKAKYSPWSPATLTTKLAIAAQNVLCAARLMNHGLICLVAFKEAPSPEVRRKLASQGYEIHVLPKNPYV